jgi:serine/threonine protein kinase
MFSGAGQPLAGRYHLLASLGRGGMGVVWRARDGMLDRDVAVKEVLCPPGLTPAEQQVLFQRTVREARAAARLHHPAVVTVFDVIEEDGRPWIVMEFVPSRSLAETIHEDGPLQPREAARVGLQVLGALTSAHAAGILHRDVKPGNVLLGADGRVVLTDFGIATLQGDATLTSSSGVIGSPAYIAPERTRGGPAEPASDLWSLGITLYAAVEGRTPYERDGAIPTLFAVATEAPDPPRQAGPLTPVLDGLLRRDPATRLSADDTRLLLGAVADDPAVRPRSAIPSPAGRAGPASGARTQAFTRAQAFTQPGRASGSSPAVPSTAALPGAGQLPIPGTGGPDDPGRKPPRRPYIAALAALVALGAVMLIAFLLLVPGRNASGRPHTPGTSPGAASATSPGPRKASSPGPSASPAGAASPAGTTPQATTPQTTAASPDSPPESPNSQSPAQGPKPKKSRKPKKS